MTRIHDASGEHGVLREGAMPTCYEVNFSNNRCSGSPLLAGIEVEPSARELPLKQRF